MRRKGQETLDMEKELSSLRERLPVNQQSKGISATGTKVSTSKQGHISSSKEKNASSLPSFLLNANYGAPQESGMALSKQHEEEKASLERRNVLEYILQQCDTLQGEFSLIDDYMYSEAVEEERSRQKHQQGLMKKNTGGEKEDQLILAPANPSYNDPFQFVYFDDLDEVQKEELLASKATAGRHKSTLVATPPPKPQQPSRSGSRNATTKGSTTTFKYGGSLQTVADSLYEIPKDVQVSLGKSKRQQTPVANTLQIQRDKESPLPEAKQEVPQSSSKIVQQKFRAPCVMKIVDEGRIRFCSSCHHVVLGAGAGLCPHCGQRLEDRIVTLLPQSGGVHYSDEEDGQDQQESQPKRFLTQAEEELYEMEKKEQEAFQRAVAEWRQAEGKPSQFRVSAQAQVEKKLPVQKKKVQPGQSLYFLHLWNQTQSMQ